VINEARFTEFYRRTSGTLWSYLYRLTKDRNLADDIMQDSYVRLINTAPEGLEDRQLKSYLYRTGTRIFFDQLRAQKRRRRWFPGSTIDADDPKDETGAGIPLGTDPTGGNDLQCTLSRVFRDLTAQERSLLWLAHVERYEHAEIAEILGLGAPSVKVMLFRARKRMKEVLETMGIKSLSDV
jgi:RNA polymerase sigma-70 factor, ECF subfamily